MRYAKFLVAAVAAGAIATQVAITDGVITNAEWLSIGIAVLGALGVVLVPNKPTDTGVQVRTGNSPY